MSDVISGIWRNAGASGFWSGWQPNVARCFIGNAAELGVYDESKTRMKGLGVPDGPLSHIGASGVAGFVSAVFSTPVTRLTLASRITPHDMLRFSSIVQVVVCR